MKKCFLLLGCVLAFVACTPGTQPVKPLIPSGTTPNTPTQPSQPEQPGQPGQPDALKVDVVTGAASDLTAFSATLNGSSAGANATIREVGFEWGPTDQMTYTEQASGTTSFSVQLQDLEPQSTYWYRAYVILQRDNEIKTFYGESRSFTTQAKDTPSSSSVPAWAEMPAVNVKEKNNYLVSSADENLYIAWHYSPDVKGPGNKPARNYTVCFSAEDHCPLWVAAPRHSMYVGSSGRTDAYKADPDIPSGIQYKSKSTGGGCNKGHMLGSAERTCSRATNEQVFYYSNIAPQLSSGFNTGGGGWNILEDFVDKQVCKDTLYEVLGCYFKQYKDGYGKSASPGKISFGGRSDVSIPTMYYYVLLRTKNGNTGKRVQDCSASELKCVAFVRAHSNDLKGQAVTSKELMSVADLEQLTGVTYFPNVPNAPKSTYSAADWGL